MSTVVQVGDIISTRLNFKDILGTVAYNQLHYKVTSIVPTPPAIYAGESMVAFGAQMAEDIFDYFKNQWSLAASIQVGFTGVTVQNIYPAPKSRQITFTAAVSQSGAENVDAMPLQDSPTLVKRTEFGQRWGIGRVFYVGLAENMQNMGNISEDAFGHLAAFGALLDDPLAVVLNGTTFNIKPVLVGAPPVVNGPPRVSDLTSVFPSGNTIKTQRRRRPGNGI